MTCTHCFRIGDSLEKSVPTKGMVDMDDGCGGGGGGGGGGKEPEHTSACPSSSLTSTKGLELVLEVGSRVDK